MAFLSRNDLFLAPMSECSGTLSFNASADIDNSLKAVVAFHQISNGSVQSQPTTSICPGRNYALKVFNPFIDFYVDDALYSTDDNIFPYGPIECHKPTQSDHDVINRTCHRQCKCKKRRTRSNQCCRRTNPSQSFMPAERSGTTTIGFLFINPNDPNNYVLQESSSGPGLVSFQPNTNDFLIHTNTGFAAALQHNGQSNNYTFVISPLVGKLSRFGYTTPFPGLLNNCQACGCPSGKTCDPSGLCRQQFLPICTSTSTCGDLNGKCSGSCPPNSTCQNVNGLFQCVPTSTTSSPLWTILLVVAVIVMIIIIGYILHIILRKPEAEITPIYAQAAPPTYPLATPYSENGSVVIASDVY